MVLARRSEDPFLHGDQPSANGLGVRRSDVPSTEIRQCPDGIVLVGAAYGSSRISQSAFWQAGEN